VPAALHDQLIKVHNVRRDLVILMSVELVRKNKHFLTLITHRNAVNLISLQIITLIIARLRANYSVQMWVHGR